MSLTIDEGEEGTMRMGRGVAEVSARSHQMGLSELDRRWRGMKSFMWGPSRVP